MTGAELRVVNGKNILDLSDPELDEVRRALDAEGFQAISVASPLLKCVLPDGPPVDGRFQHDVFASRHTFDDQERLTERAVQVAHRLGAPLIRVFSFWRTVDPRACYPKIIEALLRLDTVAQQEKLTFGLENEHACNIGTAAEVLEILHVVPAEGIQLVWDPANAVVAGEAAFPDGYRLLPKTRIAHVHAKDCAMVDGKPEWGPLGTRHVPWKEQIEQLIQDGYRGYLSLETHWPGPNNDKREASRICGWNLRGLASA